MSTTTSIRPSPYKLDNTNWITFVAMVIFHVGAIAALFFWDWKAIAVAAVLYVFSISWGIGMGYHRFHTHRSFKAPRWFEYLLAIFGTLNLEGGPIFWVATHRIHHQRSDQDGDPHSPRHGGFWAHMGWILFGRSMHNDTTSMGKYAPDLAKDPFYRWLNSYHYVPLTILGLLLGYFGGFQYVLWGVFFRVCVGLHSTWMVNSATHIWGSRRFATRDDSRNNWWVALLTFGEGWHNNHHAHPASARHGLTWYEVDFTWLQLRALQAIGVIRDMQVVSVNGEFANRTKAAA